MDDDTLFQNHRGNYVRTTRRQMEKDFGRRVLTTLYLCLRDHLPQELIVMIGRAVPRDYKVMPHVPFSLFRPRAKFKTVLTKK